MELKGIIEHIVANNELHAKWLNSLSMMENCGARKISAGEHPQKVDLIVLKHAAEEARHAYYLKNQIKKTGYEGCETYELDELLAPLQSYRYLHQLDVTISRYLKEELGYEGHTLKFAAYLLVTYAIEERADELYAVYQDALTAAGSNISVKTIIAEEKGHLEEMIAQLEKFFGDWSSHGQKAIDVETTLFNKWMMAVEDGLAVVAA